MYYITFMEKLQFLNQFFETLVALFFILGTIGSTINLVMRRIPEETYKKLEGSHPAVKHVLRIIRKIFVDLWPAIQEAKEAIKAVKEEKARRNSSIPPKNDGETTNETRDKQ